MGGEAGSNPEGSRATPQREREARGRGRAPPSGPAEKPKQTETGKSSWAGSTGRCAGQERLTEGGGRGGQIACSKDVGGEDVEGGGRVDDP